MGGKCRLGVPLYRCAHDAAPRHSVQEAVVVGPVGRRSLRARAAGRTALHPLRPTTLMMVKVLLLLRGGVVVAPHRTNIPFGCWRRTTHRTSAPCDFRKDNLEALSGLFLQVLALCQQAGLVKLGHVALDGTKVKANASKHKAMSYQRMQEKEAQLAAEVAELLRRAQAADDDEDRRYGDELPEELAFLGSHGGKPAAAERAEAEGARGCPRTRPSATSPPSRASCRQPEGRTSCRRTTGRWWTALTR